MSAPGGQIIYQAVLYRMKHSSGWIHYRRHKTYLHFLNFLNTGIVHVAGICWFQDQEDLGEPIQSLMQMFKR